MRTVQSWTCELGYGADSYHVPQNVFLVPYTFFLTHLLPYSFNLTKLSVY